MPNRVLCVERLSVALWRLSPLAQSCHRANDTRDRTRVAAVQVNIERVSLSFDVVAHNRAVCAHA